MSTLRKKHVPRRFVISYFFDEKPRFVNGKGRLLKNDLLRGVSLSNMTSIRSRRGFENDVNLSIHLRRFKFQPSSDHENACLKSTMLRVETPSSLFGLWRFCEASCLLSLSGGDLPIWEGNAFQSLFRNVQELLCQPCPATLVWRDTLIKSRYPYLMSCTCHTTLH
jgi:hypothetical protein